MINFQALLNQLLIGFSFGSGMLLAVKAFNLMGLAVFP